MRQMTTRAIHIFTIVVLTTALCLQGATILNAAQQSNRTQVKPGSLILFSPKDDIELGREAARDVEKDLSIITNSRIETYINTLGKRLAAAAPGEKYPYQFKVVNDKALNAFALPGGFIYINRGIFESADTEAQLAGVVAHEVSHVALRHSASQLSKAAITQLGIQILGGLGGKTGGMLASLGMGGTDLLLLKNSREAETQSDLLGTQLLYDTGYNTNAMAEFFEKLNEAERGGSPQFLSSHPNPDNRVGSVRKEIDKLGGSRTNAVRDTEEFQSVKRLLAGMSAPSARPKTTSAQPTNSPTNSPAGRPERPSTRYVLANVGNLTLEHPDNWRGISNSGAVTLAPNGGIQSGSLTYGMIIATYRPATSRNRPPNLNDATDQLLAQLQKVNPQLRLGGRRVSTAIAGQNALSVELTNVTASGEKETDVLITTLRSNGAMDYFVAVAPQREFSQYVAAFNKILGSVKYR